MVSAVGIQQYEIKKKWKIENKEEEKEEERR
jgi:hypothetical protein